MLTSSMKATLAGALLVHAAAAIAEAKPAAIAAWIGDAQPGVSCR